VVLLQIEASPSPLLAGGGRGPVVSAATGAPTGETLAVQAPSAFGDFFGSHYARLARACLLLTGSAAEGEDLAQEAMARVLERWDRVSRMDDPEGYVYRTALNLHRNAVRRLATAARRQLLGEAPEDPDATDRRLDLLRAIRSLPRAQREALVLVEWLGYSAEEAGRLMGIEASSVRGRLHRARERLRERVGDGHE
jgi:RNA polymerase sigma factor (sigma-70 family)